MVGHRWSPVANQRQQTMAKLARERAVKERRQRKLEKKYAAAAERRAQGAEGSAPPERHVPS